MKFVIRRQNWMRGVANARLCDPDTDHCCCLGFVSFQLGKERKNLVDVAVPTSVGDVEYLTFPYPEDAPKTAVHGMWADGKYQGETLLTSCAMGINDDQNITEEERERRLTILFGIFGHELVFEGDGRPTYTCITPCRCGQNEWVKVDSFYDECIYCRRVRFPRIRIDGFDATYCEIEDILDEIREYEIKPGTLCKFYDSKSRYIIVG